MQPIISARGIHEERVDAVEAMGLGKPRFCRARSGSDNEIVVGNKSGDRIARITAVVGLRRGGAIVENIIFDRGVIGVPGGA